TAASRRWPRREYSPSTRSGDVLPTERELGCDRGSSGDFGDGTGRENQVPSAGPIRGSRSYWCLLRRADGCLQEAVQAG
ncbi:hypothetical protein PMAYCL1PPCAC_10196, partial [Pristionchus mayeri]